MTLKLRALVAIGVATATLASDPTAVMRPRLQFGVTQTPSHQNESIRMDIILSLRGGEVHESSTLSDLESKIQNAALTDQLTIIDFTATWCGPCKMIAPVFKELSDDYGSRAQFIKVDVDDNAEAAQKYGVSAMPTFLFVKGGEVVDRLMGANAVRLKELIEEWSF
mmetsp:Transcript_8027/g.17040  ORF Transcript_8027/g.17040 Transcript_8027/m.17040 type:complete len:166 (+) Transcript_8027:70-567(+)|eukprot:CAMPEP_0171339762 /NCGR_PEP_ID=MMETSP0878-20121228/8138_1 /TAXON_ID=67004 /ORGANISM="Thalassiosira weissflogii, Strain CCMP1336" /LENGTH=165 /DNA_ID=CAMNT_0011841715 /DNA_START=29 /DNA_END=526 /DNA_ORIENTATION=+